MHSFITICGGQLENTNSLNYLDLLKIDTFHHAIFLKNHIIIHQFHRKIFKYWKSCQTSGEIFQNSHFFLENSIFIIGNKYCQFPSSILKKITAKFVSLNNCGYSFQLEQKKWLGHLATRIILEVLFLKVPIF